LSHGNPPDAKRKKLEAWVLATLPRALGYASSLLRDATLADDVVHDCYLRLLEKAEVYDLLRDGTKLLYKSITNACIDRNHRDRMILSLTVKGTEGGRRPEVEDRKQSGPLENVIHKELENAVEAGIANLPLAQRAALELKSLGYSIQEIADALETSPSNAGVLVHRARKALAEGLTGFLGSSRDDRTRDQRR
jgi:RNA polymerase sigma-70 factor (ECF subfamily)